VLDPHILVLYGSSTKMFIWSAFVSFTIFASLLLSLYMLISLIFHKVAFMVWWDI